MKLIKIGLILILTMTGQLVSDVRDKIIKEKIEVINIEVPIRVFYKGQPVDRLSRSDFKLYADKKPQNINACIIKRKKIGKNFEFKSEKQVQPLLPERYFILIFWITDNYKKIQRGLEYLFFNIFRTNDQLMITVNNTTYFYNHLRAKKESLEKIKKILQNESLLARHHMNSYLNTIKTELDQLKNIRIQQGTSSASGYKTYLKSFLERYLKILIDYRNRFLMPKVEKYYYYANTLKSIKKEKWILYFYQWPLFPTFSPKSNKWLWEVIGELQARDRPEDLPYATVLRRLLNNIDTAFQVAKEFPVEKISKLFYKVEATFHSIIMPFHKEILSEDFEYKGLSSDIENCLRELTKLTGGSIIVTDDVLKGLKTIQEKEDIYYILTYAPEKKGKIGKIKITPVNSHYKIIYDENVIDDSTITEFEKNQTKSSKITIKNITLKNNQLHIQVTDFLLKKNKNKVIGNIVVQVKVKNDKGEKIFDQAKNLITKKKIVNISLNFNRLTQGRYDFIVDVMDIFSENRAIKTIQSEIIKKNNHR